MSCVCLAELFTTFQVEFFLSQLELRISLNMSLAQLRNFSSIFDRQYKQTENCHCNRSDEFKLTEKKELTIWLILNPNMKSIWYEKLDEIFMSRIKINVTAFHKIVWIAYFRLNKFLAISKYHSTHLIDQLAIARFDSKVMSISFLCIAIEQYRSQHTQV